MIWGWSAACCLAEYSQGGNHESAGLCAQVIFSEPLAAPLPPALLESFSFLPPSVSLTLSASARYHTYSSLQPGEQCGGQCYWTLLEAV